jgi:hypothetical protein
MSTATVTVRYDGPILADHRMDIADLAPALLGLSELCKIANRKFNGDRAAVKVLIGTDVEHQCFQIDLHVVQTLWETTKGLLADSNVSSAKEFLEWLGLISTGVTGVVGFFKLLKHLHGRKITSTHMEIKDGKDVVVVTVEGDNNIVLVYPQTLELLRDDNAVVNAKKVVQPLALEGYDHVEFEDHKEIVERISKEDAIDIVALNPAEIELGEKDQPQEITAWISVYAPVFDIRAKKWRFKFGDAHEYMDITDTNISAMAILRGCAMIDDAYRVRLEITQEHKPSGGVTNHYKIKEVLEFRPGRLPYQSDAFRDHKITPKTS